jgi:peptide/nickel transport system permease protein
LLEVFYFLKKVGEKLVGKILKKVLKSVVFLFVLSIIVFYISRLAPGDPLVSYYGDSVNRMTTQEKMKAVSRLGLDKPIYIQYKEWIIKAAKGDFGISLKYKRNTVDVIKEVYKNTLVLGGISYILTFVISLILGIFCALRENSFADKLIIRAGTVLNSIPSFWMSLILILVFSINLNLLPTSGAYSIGGDKNLFDRITHLVLPISVLVLSHLWYYAYMVRNKFVEEIRKDYVLLYRTKGLNHRDIVYKHCLRNILPSYISMIAVSAPHIIAGTYVVEKIFSYPGLGTLCFESAKYHDYNMLLVLCLITGIVVVVLNDIAEFVNGKIDPRLDFDRGDNNESLL